MVNIDWTKMVNLLLVYTMYIKLFLSLWPEFHSEGTTGTCACFEIVDYK